MRNPKSWLNNKLSDQYLASTVDKYLVSKTSDRWQAWQLQLRTEKFYLPVFGVQGCGKSTLLNALLFDDRVLPTDAQETTCAPAEIHYNPDLKGQAKVVYQDGSSKYVEAKDNVLAPYIDNVSNPANEKGVKVVEVYSDDDILKNGLVLADLPGIGSLTTANQETTMDYLNKSSGVIFMIRSVPPLTRTESGWIRMVWPLLPQAIFCQSCWDTEGNEEIEDARDHNLSVLSKEREIIWGDKFEDPKLLCVNGEGALNAKFKGDHTAFEECGAVLLRDTITRYSFNWKELILSETMKYWTNDLNKALETIDKRLDLMQGSAQALEEAINTEKRLFSEYKEVASKKIESAKQKLHSYTEETKAEINKLTNEYEMTFRNNMRTKLRAGIVDGERLNLAFQAEASDISEQLYFHVQDKITILQSELMSSLEGIEEWSSQYTHSIPGFETPEKIKYENIFPIIGNAVGGVGGGVGGYAAGAAAGSALAGTTFGAKIGAALGLSLGPAGALVGGLLGGAIGGLVLVWLGRKAKTLVTDVRIDKIEPQIFSAAREYIDSTRYKVIAFFETFTSDTKAQFDSWLQQQQYRYEHEESMRVVIKGLEKEDKDMQINILLADRDTLKQAIISQE